MAWLGRLLDQSLALVFIIMTVVTALQVGFRYALNRPILGAEEIALLCAVWMTFLGSVVATRDHTHIAIDILVERLPRKWASAAQIVSASATLFFSLLLMVEGTKLAIFSHAFESSALRFPMSLFYTALPLCAALTVLYAARDAWRQRRAFRRVP